MTSLTIALNGGVPLREIALSPGRTTLGRRPYNDIVIDHLAVSGEHALFLLHPDGAVELIDLHSTNGTYVNGRAIASVYLHPEDRIEIAQYQLQVRFGAAAHPVPPAVAPAPPVPPAAPQAPAPAPPSTTAPLPQACVRVLSGAASGKEMRLSKAVTTLGKPGLAVAIISQQGTGHVLASLEGQSPLLNGSPLGPQAALLAHQDRITLAGVEMQYLLLG